MPIKAKNRLRNKLTKSQVSMEYLLITAFAMLLTIPLIIIFMDNARSFNDSVEVSQANRVASDIVSNAEIVHYLGEPSQRVITVYMPQDVWNITYTGNGLTIVVSHDNGNFIISKYTPVNISGTISTYPGLHVIKIRAENDSVFIE